MPLTGNSPTTLEEQVRELSEWKADALQSLAQWHALSDALFPFFALSMGDNIPVELARVIPLSIRELITDREAWRRCAGEAAQQAQDQRATAARFRTLLTRVRNLQIHDDDLALNDEIDIALSEEKA